MQVVDPEFHHKGFDNLINDLKSISPNIFNA